MSNISLKKLLRSRAVSCLCPLALLLLAGCTAQNRLSQRAWSQTATQEQQQQQLRADPQGDRDMLPY